MVQSPCEPGKPEEMSFCTVLVPCFKAYRCLILHLEVVVHVPANKKRQTALQRWTSSSVGSAAND